MKTVAGIIIQQLGGNRFIAMTGAKNFATGGKDASFKIGKNAGKVSHIKITLNDADLYDMEFFNIRGMNIKTVAERNGIYCDQLQREFSEVTGMATSL